VVQINEFAICSFVKTVTSSRRPLSTTNFFANEQLLVSRISSFICNCDRQFAMAFIFLCVVICTNIKRGLRNTVQQFSNPSERFREITNKQFHTFLQHIIVYINAWPRCVSSFGKGQDHGLNYRENGLPSLLFNRHVATTSPYKVWGVQLIANVRLVSSLRMRAVTPTVSHTRAQSDA